MKNVEKEIEDLLKPKLEVALKLKKVIMYLKQELVLREQLNEGIIEDVKSLVDKLYLLGYIETEGSVNYTGDLTVDYFLGVYEKTSCDLAISIETTEEFEPLSMDVEKFVNHLAEVVKARNIPVKIPIKCKNGNYKFQTMRYVFEFMDYFDESLFYSNYDKILPVQLGTFERFIDINGLYDLDKALILMSDEALEKNEEEASVILGYHAANSLLEHSKLCYRKNQRAIEEKDEMLITHITLKHMKKTYYEMKIQNNPFTKFWPEVDDELYSPKDFIYSTLAFAEDNEALCEAFARLKEYMMSIGAYRGANTVKPHFTVTYTDFDPIINLGIVKNLFGKDVLKYEEYSAITLVTGVIDNKNCIISPSELPSSTESILEALKNLL